MAALHKTIRKKLLHKRNYVGNDFMCSQHEFLLNRGYFDIPELNIETSSFKAVFAQIIVKRELQTKRKLALSSLLPKP